MKRLPGHLSGLFTDGLECRQSVLQPDVRHESGRLPTPVQMSVLDGHGPTLRFSSIQSSSTIP